MQIQQIQLDRTGNRSELTVQELSPGLNVILGSPLSGKSTLTEFVRSFAKGRSASSNGLNDLTGSLLVSCDDGRYQLTRKYRAGVGSELSLSPRDGAVPHRSTEQVLPQLSERLCDKVFHAAFRQGCDIEGAVAEAEAALTQHSGNASAVREVERRLAVLESRRADWVRSEQGDSPLNVITRRREQLLAEIDGIESQWGERSGKSQRRRAELEQLAVIREGSLADANRRLDAIELEINAIDAEHQDLLRQYEQLQRNTDEELSCELQTKLSRTTEQMLRWNRVLADVVERRDRIRTELVEWATGGDENGELGGPAGRIAAMEQLITDLKTSIQSFEASPQAVSHCGCRKLHDDCNHSIRDLRDHLFELCEELSRQQYKYRRNAMNSELKQLRRCHTEVTQYLQRLVKRRNQFLRRLGEVDPSALARIVREHSELCEVEDNDALFDLVSIRSFDFATDWEAVQRRLGEIDYQLEELRATRGELNREAEEHRTQLTEIQGELNTIGRPCDIDAVVAEKRAELREFDARHSNRLTEWNALNDEINVLVKQIEQLRSNRRTVNVLAEASHYLRELTSNDFVALQRSLQTGALLVESRSGKSYTWEAVAQQTRDLAHLAVCLASVAHLQREGVRCPMILDDLFAHIDEDRIAIVAGVLKRYAESDRQILSTTGWELAATRCESIGVRVAPLASSTVTSTSPAMTKPVAVEAVEEPTFGDGIPDDTYYLERTDPIEETPDLEYEAASELRGHGVDTIGDLLSVSVEDLAAWSNVPLTSAQLRHCQGVSGLLCDVINLRPYDVRILVCAGIQDAQQLRRMTSEQLLSRVEAFVRTTEGRALLVSGDDFELARVANWIRSARESREFHRETERQQALRDAKERTRGTSHGSLSIFGPKDQGERSSRRGASPSGRRPRPSAEKRSRKRSTAPRPSRSSSKVAKSDSPASGKSSSDLKFHLGRKSYVEAAPSIGPKMAEHLAKVGVVTVGDLLEGEPAAITSKLDHRRVNSETVRLWQRQAEWVCRVPEIRGHDAQFLVACGYETVEELSGVDSQELFEAVTTMVDSKQGRRILRGGKKPDLAEIVDWINFANQSRELKAA